MLGVDPFKYTEGFRIAISGATLSDQRVIDGAEGTELMGIDTILTGREIVSGQTLERMQPIVLFGAHVCFTPVRVPNFDRGTPFRVTSIPRSGR